MHPELINLLIQKRRSVKPELFNDKPVDDTVIMQMLENARWAPTHGMTEPWRFVVFAGAGRIKFAEFVSGLYKKFTPEERFLEQKYQKMRNMPLQASHIILIFMKRQETEKIPEVEEICSVACAVQNMQLTAAAYGVGCYWSTGSMTGHEEIKQFAGLGVKDKCLGMLIVGNYDTAPDPKPRHEMTDRSVWVRES